MLCIISVQEVVGWLNIIFLLQVHDVGAFYGVC